MTQAAALKKKNSAAKRWISVALFALSAILLIVSILGFVFRTGESTQNTLNRMRTDAVLHAASAGLIDSITNDASAAALKELRARKDFRTMGKNAIEEYCGAAAEKARAEAEVKYANTDGVDTAALESKIDVFEQALSASKALRAAEESAYAELYTDLYESVGDWTDFVGDLDDAALFAAIQAEVEAISDADADAFVAIARGFADAEAEKDAKAAEAEAAETEGGEEGGESAEGEEITEEVSNEIVVDYGYFAASGNLLGLESVSDAAYDDLMSELTKVIPDLGSLDAKTKKTVRETLENVIYSGTLDFSTRYDIYARQNADQNLTGSEAFRMKLAASAETLLIAGVALLLLALTVTFWSQLIARMGVPRTIILLFFIYLLLAARLYSINVPLMLGNVLERVCMYGILALAMLPGIQCGIGLNMGMTLGCISGLLAIVLSLQFNMTGAAALIFSCAIGALIAVPLGWAYSLLLNRMKGSEMTIATYVGFSFVSLMCIGWMLLPFNNTKIIWLLRGRGLRVTHSLLGSFAHLLDRFLAFEVFGIEVPTGCLLFFLLCCLIMWLFSRSKAGIAMSAVGSNPRFAQACGINVDHMRTLGTVLSTVLAAIGIVIYSQAFGYAQLYTAPRQLGFLAASAILIGGATVSKAKVSHVIIGVFLFEGVLAAGQQIANAAFSGGGLSEVMRIMISNGIILYALTQSGGGNRD